MGEVPGLGYSNQGNGLLSERNRLGRWQRHVLGFSFVDMSQGSQSIQELVRMHCTQGAGSSSSLLWILSKPQDCSKALDWLGYSLVGRPRAARQSHDLHLTVPMTAIIWLKLFLLSFSSCAFRFMALIQVFIWPAVVSRSRRNNCFVHLQSPEMESRAGGPFSSLTRAYFCWAHILHGEHWSNLISAVF